MTRYLRAANVKDGELDLADVKEMNFEPKEQQLFALHAGDILVTEGSGSIGAVGASAVWAGELAGTVCFQNTLLRIRPRPSTDGRFLAWWCRHAFADGLFASVATGANIFHLSAERVRSLPMAYLPLQRQRAIAAFLDTETARIEALITKKCRMIDLLAQKLEAERDRVVWSGSPRTAPLRHLTRSDRPIMYGIVLPGPDVKDGVPIVKGGDVTAGFARPLCRTTHEIESRYARSRLRTADLVFAIRGGVGDVALVPPEVAGANITQDVARITPDESVEPQWLRHVLQSLAVQSEAAERTTGATIRGLNIEALKLIRVPWVDQPLQRAQSRELDAVELAVGMLTAKLREQIALLREHRQALITAAVTGELEMPRVAA